MTAPGRALAGLNVSRETLERFELYEALVRKWNPTINLVSRSTIDHIWQRHFADSAQLLGFASDSARSWADLGSGAGFPGLVVTMLARELRPRLKVTLVESDRRKAAFLTEVVRRTDLSVAVIAERAETLTPLNADIISARALAPLRTLMALAERHLKPRGTGLFLKGARSAAEVKDALETFRFTLQKFPSQTDPGAVILSVGEITRV